MRAALLQTPLNLLALLATLHFAASATAAPPWRYSGSGPWSPPTAALSNVYDPPDGVIPLEAIVSESPLQITLKIYSSTTPSSGNNTNVSGTYDIFRKAPDASSWGTPIGTVTVGTAIATWDDTNVTVGQMYEYGLANAGTTVMKFGNVLAGIKVDRTQPRGRIAVVVAADIPVQLPVEYAQYKSDLVADGWVVHEVTTPRAADYLSNSTGTNALATVVVGSGGSGYVNDQTIVFSNGTSTALGTIKATTSPGPITSVVVTYGASGFTAGQALTFTGNAAGTGAALTVGTVTSGTAGHISIRNQLIALYNAYPGEFKNVVLLGKVPAVRSGIGYTGPDGHGNRAAVGADAYYADMDGVWSDTGNNLNQYSAGANRDNAIADGSINLAGDNKFDPTELSEVISSNANVELGFGRIDLFNNVPGGYEAMRMYFNKLHRYKTASPDFLPGRKAIMRSSFGMVTKAYLGGMPGVLGMTQLDYIQSADLPTVPVSFDADAAYTAQNSPYLFYFKGSGGPEYSEGGRAVFWTGMQSHWGYWYLGAISSGSNLMQRRLAEDNYCLSFTWSIGLLYLDTSYLYHRMGMGFDAGDMMRASISNRRSATSLYVKAESPLFMNHMGDPTLRLFMFPPPTDLSVTPSSGSPALSWTAAQAPAAGEPPVLGYHVYRASTSAGPFTRLTSVPVAGTTYLDAAVTTGSWSYLVRAVRLETTGGGTYYNASLGAQQSIDLTNGPAALTVATTSLPDANWDTPYQATLAATGGTPIFSWTLLSGTLPPGLTLSSSGNITGLATAGGTYGFTVQATDQAAQAAQKALSITAQSSNVSTYFAEANSYCGSFNTVKWSFYEPSLLMAGPSYLYQPFLRFDLSGLDVNHAFVRARLVLTLDERSQSSSYALTRAALTQDAGDGWIETGTGSITYATRPLDDTTVPQAYASSFPAAYGTIEIDVTAQVQATLQNDAAKKVGLRLYTTRNNSFGSEVRIATRYASGNARPRLIIETTDAPAITITSPVENAACLNVGSSLVIQATATAIPAQAGSLTVQWTRFSGPGTVTFGTPALASTTATFSAPGDYILRLTASDGLLTSTKDLTVRVLSVPAGTTLVSGPAFDPSLILRLPFDETTGAAATDVSGVSPANNGTLATLGVTGNPTWVPAGGKVGGAINFDGVGQRVEINDSATTPLDGMQKLTASLWVKLNAADANAHGILVKQTTSSASTSSYSITLTNAEKISVNVANKTAVVGDTILAVGQWYHVAMIFDGSLAANHLQLYINGNPDKFGAIATGQANNAIPRISASKLRVGDYAPAAVTASFNGQVDEVRLYNRALSLDEIQLLAQAAPANLGPVITAPTSVTGTAGQAFALNATVTDDALPGPLTLAWSTASGPGSLMFTSPAASSTQATAALGGVYSARLTADDGAIKTWADIIATVTGGSAYQSWLQANGLPSDGSGAGSPTANPSGDGVKNGMKFALGLPVNSAGYAGRLTTGTHAQSGSDYLSLTYIRPEPAPAGVSYTVKISTDLTTWSAAETTEVSNTLDGALRTITIRDTVPTSGTSTERFIRLEVTLP